MDDGADQVGVEDVAEWLGVTARRVQMLAADGVIPREERGRYQLKGCVQAYCGHMARQAAGRGDDELSKERARLAREQANRAARQNALETGEMVPREDMVLAMQTTFAHVRARILAIPSRAAPLLEGLKPAAIREKLTELVSEACDGLRRTRAVPVSEDGDGDAGVPGGDGRAAGVHPAAAADGERMG